MKQIGLILCVIVLLAVSGCGLTKSDVQETSVNDYVKFQDRMSMDWDVVQDYGLVDTAIYYAGFHATPEEYAYNIIVSLNRMLSPDYPNTLEDICIFFPEELSRPKAAFQGMDLVTAGRWDETNGSMEYIIH